MIFAKIFLTWIFMKIAPMCSRGLTVYQKNKNNFVEGFKMGGDRQKWRKFSLLDRLLKAVESILRYLLHVKFSEFSKIQCFFFIILRVSRTFEHVLLDCGPYFNKLTESRFEVPWSPIFPDRLKICGRGRASFDQKKLSANRFADVRILGMCIINDHLCAGRNKLRKLPVKIFYSKIFKISKF